MPMAFMHRPTPTMSRPCSRPVAPATAAGPAPGASPGLASGVSPGPAFGAPSATPRTIPGSESPWSDVSLPAGSDPAMCTPDSLYSEGGTSREGYSALRGWSGVQSRLPAGPDAPPTRVQRMGPASAPRLAAFNATTTALASHGEEPASLLLTSAAAPARNGGG